MTKSQWIQIAKEITPHLQAIQQVINGSEIAHLHMSAGDGIYAQYICDGTYSLRIDGDICQASFIDASECCTVDIKKALTPGSN